MENIILKESKSLKREDKYPTDGSTMTSSPSKQIREPGIFGLSITFMRFKHGLVANNDYTRFARTPRQAILGQLVSFPCYSICATVGILVTVATQDRYGQPLWNLPALLSAIMDDAGSRSRVAAFFGGAVLSVSQMGLDVPANALAGGFDMAATFLRYINLRRGAYITVLVDRMQSVEIGQYGYYILSSSDLFAVMRRRIKVEDLFPCHADANGIYWYTYGVNWRAPVALWGMVPSLPGFVAHVDPSVAVPVGLTRIYYICFFTGTAISAGVYTALHCIISFRPLK
ncbi:permease for cytosine/purines, uracil, thiamine, allantoin-domain-containing protein [Aspergillus sergii]|uniref:Permease for cytosine/purines, uracil, thiamine, allantoin-domain-containing protein n=1 Tax=Aspergillus sergii TaxID=1034303 RepID=A0A5N6XG63_9EURO|nr:permease for cytosine/purines, uracil, thiamine, allantoin-domain-containing protein [Aspergillus sergii]